MIVFNTHTNFKWDFIIPYSNNKMMYFVLGSENIKIRLVIYKYALVNYGLFLEDLYMYDKKKCDWDYISCCIVDEITENGEGTRKRIFDWFCKAYHKFHSVADAREKFELMKKDYYDSI